MPHEHLQTPQSTPIWVIPAITTNNHCAKLDRPKRFVNDMIFLCEFP